MSGSSVERVRAALLAAGHADSIRAFPEGTRSAAEAAAAVGARPFVNRARDARARLALVPA